jgi:hypothetical protein
LERRGIRAGGQPGIEGNGFTPGLALAKIGFGLEGRDFLGDRSHEKLVHGDVLFLRHFAGILEQ